MEQYLGVKLISAEKCWGLNNKCVDPNSERCGKEVDGYKVVYEDGYTSWSPKDIFEKAYKQIKTLNFKVKFDGENSEYKNRVIQEAAELQEKIDKLELFIKNNPVYQSLVEEEQLRLIQQFRAMQYYLTVLVERIENF